MWCGFFQLLMLGDHTVICLKDNFCMSCLARCDIELHIIC